MLDNKVHVVYGSGWFVEFGSEALARQALEILGENGTEAQYKHCFREEYALVVQQYENNIGSPFPGTRRHRWAYGKWIKGAPVGWEKVLTGNEFVGAVSTLVQVRRVYNWDNGSPGATLHFKDQSLLTDEEIEKLATRESFSGGEPVERIIERMKLNTNNFCQQPV